MLRFRPPYDLSGTCRKQPNSPKPTTFSIRIAAPLIAVLGLPASIVLIAALMGFGSSTMPSLSSWIMGGLTVASSIMFAASVGWCLRKRTLDWFWLLVTGSASLFWASVFYQSLR